MNNRKKFEELKNELEFLQLDANRVAYGLPPRGEALDLLKNRMREQNLRIYKKYENEINKVVENFDCEDKMFKEIEGIKFGVNDCFWCKELIKASKSETDTTIKKSSSF